MRSTAAGSSRRWADRPPQMRNLAAQIGVFRLDVAKALWPARLRRGMPSGAKIMAGAPTAATRKNQQRQDSLGKVREAVQAP